MCVQGWHTWGVLPNRYDEVIIEEKQYLTQYQHQATKHINNEENRQQNGWKTVEEIKLMTDETNVSILSGGHN